MSNRTQKFVLIAVLVMLDALTILFAWWLAYELRLDSELIPYFGDARPEEYRDIILASLPLWLIIFAFCRLYDREELLGGPQEYGNVVKGSLLGFVTLVIMSMFVKAELARTWLLLGLVLVILLDGLMRFAVRRVFYSMRRHNWFVQRALIVGANDDARAIAHQLTPYTHSGVQIVGFVDDYLPVGTLVVDGLRVVAPTSMLHEITHEQQVDQVILVSGAMTWESFDQLLRGITVARQDTYAIKLSPGFYETLTTGVRVSYKNRVPLLEIERAPITGIDALLKGILDYVLGGLAFVLSLPLMLGITLGLVLYGQRTLFCRTSVLGKNGKTFTMHLFNAVFPESQPWIRGQRFGTFLFATGLNKLPQLLQVLRGRMSLVGPRPVNAQYAALYQAWLPNLLSLKPGMTGARASSAEKSITLEQEMRLELYYARNYSIWLDLQILFQTAVRVFKRERVLRKPEADAGIRSPAWMVSTMPPASSEQGISS